jgi:benzoate membrane transport protein
MRASVVISAVVAVLVGFGGSVAIILAAAKAVGANPEQTSSWIAALCVSTMATTAILSLRHRIPILAAWSTPGAALIGTSSGISMEQAVGAFFLTAVLILVTAAFRPIASLIERIPTAIASAMLAGVLLGFVLAVFEHLPGSPALVLPLVVAFFVLRLYSPAWAVLAVLFLGVGLAYLLGLTRPVGDLPLSSFVWVRPDFDPATLLGLGVPLYLVTMASQNLPGFAVLKAAGYSVPSRSILTVTGLASLLTAGVGAHTSNLAAITASICTGPDAHPDKDKRWLCGPFYAGGYAVLAIFGASLVALFASFPEALIATVAGIALTGPLVNALGASLKDNGDRFAAVVTFAVTASGMSVFGIGSAFWGLIAGLVVYGLDRTVRRKSA